jgi:hypothetical protein
MNNENLEFLADSLKYMGFGDKGILNDQLSKHIAKESKTFELETEAYFDEKFKLDLTLHFRKSDQLDMYFFTKYEARLRAADTPDLDRGQVFYISKGTGVALQEAFNLLQGRAVNKDLTNAEGQKYNAWIQLNFSDKDQHDNYKVKQYRPQYGYDLEKTLEKYPIGELKEAELKANLIKSLQKGNQELVTFEKSSSTQKMFIEANPQYKTINIYPSLSVGLNKENSKSDAQPGKMTDQTTDQKNKNDGDDLEGDKNNRKRVKRGR